MSEQEVSQQPVEAAAAPAPVQPDVAINVGSTPSTVSAEDMEESKTMLAATLTGAVSGGIREFTMEDLREKVKLERLPIPKPRPGQVLIKVARSCILPMNMSELKATYGTWNKDNIDKAIQLGSEGCGVVVESGGGITSPLAWRLVGKRVAFFRYNAAWAEYACVSYTQVMEIGEKPFDHAVSAFANPMTTMAFLEIADTHKCKTIVHTAAASALGMMLIRHGRRRGIKVICVVRRDEQVQDCLREGALAALNSNSDTFHADLKAVCEKYQAKIAFDAVAGKLTGDVLNAMPNGSKIHVYGGLSEERPIISTRDLIFKQKSVDGFWLKDYAASKYSLMLYQWVLAVSFYLEKDFQSKVQDKIEFHKLHEGILAYSKNMGAGKIILDMQPMLK